MDPHGDMDHGCAGMGEDQQRQDKDKCLDSNPRGDNVMSSRRGALHPQQEQRWEDVLIHLLYVRDSVFAKTELMLCEALCVRDKTSQPTSRNFVGFTLDLFCNHYG